MKASTFSFSGKNFHEMNHEGMMRNYYKHNKMKHAEVLTEEKDRFLPHGLGSWAFTNATRSNELRKANMLMLG